ncbi:hypothetical protein SKAU_G00413910 [Synaphobranchus kaupii]|uniref:Uncharacterized protein n=1 Tax=Synaphobranchus kaupii TaxID=118154 RepID=A0A9Q1E6Z8_SYNKA|nr:hypothetical protein SKAU_G00413910 [Synaphobranchus kaupii]
MTLWFHSAPSKQSSTLWFRLGARRSRTSWPRRQPAPRKGIAMACVMSRLIRLPVLLPINPGTEFPNPHPLKFCEGLQEEGALLPVATATRRSQTRSAHGVCETRLWLIGSKATALDGALAVFLHSIRISTLHIASRHADRRNQGARGLSVSLASRLPQLYLTS